MVLRYEARVFVKPVRVESVCVLARLLAGLTAALSPPESSRGMQVGTGQSKQCSLLASLVIDAPRGGFTMCFRLADRAACWAVYALLVY